MGIVDGGLDAMLGIRGRIAFSWGRSIEIVNGCRSRRYSR